MTRLMGIVLLGAAAVAAGSARAAAQEPRLAGRLPEPVRRQVDALLDSARTSGLPTEPLVDRALEGASKRADGERIVAAVRRLAGELVAARDALGLASSSAELTAAASALRAGARPEDLRRLRVLRARQPVTVAAAVLADLVAVGVPADTAASAVIALARSADDATYLAFRRNIERDVALGASPIAALGVRLTITEGDGATAQYPGPRKP
jgi:hypothetical protein